MKKTVAILLAVLMIFAMGACTSDESGAGGNTAAGTYTMKSMTMAGQTFELEALEELLTAGGVNINDLKVELKDNGDFTMTMLAGDVSETVNGTWKADGNNISMTAEGDTTEATLNGNELTIGDDDVSMVFKK